ncbi:MAG: hypothetical protein A2W25_01895 [candidate division Zixibacteria bacterium RBG_16_53_22]|nr:MAG: hypothetical protein A2W25_01895 [candidate division Zixibacteria bacterium RBG_16_53_22]
MHYQEIGGLELARARAKLYQLLGALYFKPYQPEMLSLLAQWVKTRAAADFRQTFSAEINLGLSLLKDFFREKSGNTWPELGEIVSVEFTRLFRGVKIGYSPPPPYESVYREETGRVFGEVTVAVWRKYRSFGFSPVKELKNEPPDHLGLEMEFMHRLCSLEADAWQEADVHKAHQVMDGEREFCREHLLTWLPQWRDRIREFDSPGFFRGLAELTLGWVAFDYNQNLIAEAASCPTE